MSLRSVVRMVARRAGLEIDRWPPRKSLEALLGRIVTRYDVDSVVDVGANVGSWSTSIRQLGYDGPIFAFEPVESAYQELTKRAAADPSWQVRKAAVGNVDGDVTMKVAASSSLSSLLEVDEAAVLRIGQGAEKRIVTVGQEVVEMVRLDKLAVPGHRVLLKVDTQGYDSQVLDGAAELLERAVAVQCELSLHPLYRGMANNWRDMVERLEQAGFEVAGMFPIASDEALCLQEMDGVFVRPQATVGC